jgi:hypothetical protein
MRAAFGEKARPDIEAMKRYATTMVTKAVKITLTTGNLLRKRREWRR